MRQIRYNLPRSRKKSRQPFAWLLVLALAAVLAWLWWQSIQPPHRAPATLPAAVAPKITPTNSVRAPTAPAPLRPGQYPRPVQNIFEAQVALVGQGISSGSIDGSPGSQTRAALAAFQRQEGIPVTGQLDAATKTNLLLDDAPYTTYTISTNDLARLQPIAATWLGKSQQSALDFENILELVAEKSFTHPGLVRRLNPNIDWNSVAPGTVVQLPNTAYPDAPGKAAWVTIHLATKYLEAYDADTNLIAHFPCSIARQVEKRPVGLLRVVVVAPHPNYTFDPDVFPESPEAHQLQRKLVLPPGPNNPVGVAWIGLDRPGYGIHGTSRPEDVGRTESHGCFRLANWNAEYLLRLITIGTPVYVVE